MSGALFNPKLHGREVNPIMAHSLTKLMAGCAAVLLVLFAVACAEQPTTQDQTSTPSTTTSQAPGQDQAAPAQDQAAAPAQDQAAAPAQDKAGQPAQPPAAQPPQN